MAPPGIHATELAILAMATVATAGSATGFLFLLGCGRFRPFAAIRSFGPWLYAVLLATVLATTQLTATRAAALWVIAEAVPAILLFAAAVRRTGFARPSGRVLRDSIRFGVRAWVGSMSFFLNARVDQVITDIAEAPHEGHIRGKCLS